MRLYSWLDGRNAIECGNGVAALAYETESVNFNDVYNEVQSELEELLNLESSDRIYLIMKDEADNRMKGKFLFGKRKRAEWEGYSVEEQEDPDLF